MFLLMLKSKSIIPSSAHFMLTACFHLRSVQHNFNSPSQDENLEVPEIMAREIPLVWGIVQCSTSTELAAFSLHSNHYSGTDPLSPVFIPIP